MWRAFGLKLRGFSRQNSMQSSDKAIPAKLFIAFKAKKKRDPRQK
jgi:hypothetical protein